jgi:3'(2'), 5'-bisphosphate nucleotidase
MALDTNRWLPVVIEAALAAGKETLSVYGTDFAVSHKADRSPLTLADERSHAIIHGYLAPSDIPVLSEEGRRIPYDERSRWPLLWIVDPLDGTKEFVNRNGEFTVNIALVDAGLPCLGVVFAPVPDQLYFAAQNLGAFRLDRAASHLAAAPQPLADILAAAQPLPLDHPPGALAVVASRSHLNTETAHYIDTLRQSHPELGTVSRGSSLKLCLVAEGSAHVYPRFAPTMEWDTAAGHALVRMSGGRVLVAETRIELGYNRQDLLNPAFIALAANCPETLL